MPTYTPTTWVDGAAPGISATELNRIETGVDGANQAIDDHSSDVANPHATPVLAVFATGDIRIRVKTGTGRLKMPFAATLISATPTLGVAGTGADVIVDVNKNGNTMFTTKPLIAAGATDGAKQSPTTSVLAIGDIVTVDVDQVGSTLPGENLTVILELRPV